ncbi:MAG TPA: ABC transporter permease [Planctomycetota bacterium]|nr:ABC transporter permease [Planctomycetota bacterium]
MSDASDVPWTLADAPLLPRALKRTISLPVNLVRHRALWIAGARRELAARLSGTVLGKAWPLVQPLALFLVYYTLFARIFGMRFSGSRDDSGAQTAAYIFLGVVVWSAFAESLSRATSSFTDRGELLKRVAFPAEVLPFQSIVAQQVLMLAGLLAYAAVTSVVSFTAPLMPPLGTAIWLVPLLFVMQALFTLGLALATATMHALLRDTIHLVGMLTTVWMFATPVFWIPSPRVLPGVEPYLGWLEWNPMHAFVSCWRYALLNGTFSEAFTSSLADALGHAAAWTAAALLVGGFLFALGERRLPDEV